MKSAFAELARRGIAGRLDQARLAVMARALAGAAPETFMPDALAEALLKALLARPEPPLEREVIIAGLGKVGGIEAVAVLVPWRDKLLGGKAADAARDAIAAIQARAGNPEAGGLHLADGGALALTESERGE